MTWYSEEESGIYLDNHIQAREWIIDGKKGGGGSKYTGKTGMRICNMKGEVLLQRIHYPNRVGTWTAPTASDLFQDGNNWSFKGTGVKPIKFIENGNLIRFSGKKGNKEFRWGQALWL